ncbi:MAG: phosphoribosylaminoimidazolesuccinocarboxamide synthase [Candidatus Omnitrophica bacterium]|nr:phosphoribosylaminoimidazolesuccinocarboxamide synthase [Candidatus Omnitrophota bacterium]MCM8801835.1 phosphoribosylaminoimidazolesuccinocarboxamide synthase [Candidatus Omnitrophota bacterium]
MGSVKDLVILEKAKKGKVGVGRFIFTDRYSVFDWGEMPDHILGKGKSICISTAYFFEEMEKNGIKTHYIGLVDKKGNLKKLNELEQPTDTLQFRMLRVLKPKIKGNSYDYSVYKKERVNYLIPLEIIYRNYLSENSSIFKRLKEGSITLEDIGLKEYPTIGQILEKPIIDISTKLETTDRYLKWDEAKEIANLTDYEIEEIKLKTLKINEIITKEVEKVGLINEDGKIEFGFDEDRNLILVDAVGTLDECRFTYNGIPVSKEIARIYYRKTDWFKNLEEAKKKDKIKWREYVNLYPPKLPEKLCVLISSIYESYANEITQRKWFDVPPLKEVLAEIKKFI